MSGISVTRKGRGPEILLVHGFDGLVDESLDTLGREPGRQSLGLGSAEVVAPTEPVLGAACQAVGLLDGPKKLRLELVRLVVGELLESHRLLPKQPDITS